MEWGESTIEFGRMSGALADVNYNNDPKNNSFDVLSLKELCASKLVSNALLLRNAHSTIPPRLKEILMYTAINKGRFPSIKYLLKSWPYDKLNFPVPEICRTCNMHLLHKLDSLSQLVSCTTLILRKFIQPLSSLKYLDLSAMPLNSYQISIISSLATSEFSRNCNSEFVVYLNCSLQRRQSLEELCSAFAAQKAGQSRVKLVMKALHITPEICHEGFITLLRLLNSHELELFSCDFCFGQPSLQDVFSLLKNFHSLKALSLPYVGSPREWKPLLDELVNLERLDLHSNRIEDQLEYSLSGMYKKTHQCCSSNDASTSSGSKLKYLNVVNCSLTNESILYLASSSHSMSLSYLNLNHTRHCKLTNLVSLLKACKNLIFLELENSVDSNLNLFFEVLPSLNKLKYLSIAPKMHTEYFLSFAPLIRQMPSLLHLRIRYVFKLSFEYGNLDEFIEQLKICLRRPAPLKKINFQVIYY